MVQTRGLNLEPFWSYVPLNLKKASGIRKKAISLEIEGIFYN